MFSFNWKDSIYDESGKYFRGSSARPRNCARTTIAPTGTIAITAGLQGSGIEPFFAIVYKRYQAEAVDSLKKVKNLIKNMFIMRLFLYLKKLPNLIIGLVLIRYLYLKRLLIITVLLGC